jgi:hypothetical protein
MDFESHSLGVLVDCHNELCAALKSLGGKQARGYLDNFKFWSSDYMSHASLGFIHLRKAGCIEESRFLVRPAIELMFKQRAIERRPDLIYRLGLTETRSDWTWIKALAEESGETFNSSTHDAELKRFEKDCRKLFPSGDFRDVKLTIEELAKVIDGGAAYYNSHYRTHCKFTHATLRAIIGGLNEVTTDEDNLTMIRNVLCSIDALVSMGGVAPKLDRLRSAKEDLEKERMDGAQ